MQEIIQALGHHGAENVQKQNRISGFSEEEEKQHKIIDILLLHM